jgi:integral membrane protein
MLRSLHYISRLEAISWLMLIAAIVVKYAGDNENGVKVMGPIHGVLFLVYAALILGSFNELGWPFSRAVRAMVLGAVPFGGFWVDEKWLPKTRTTTS